MKKGISNSDLALLIGVVVVVIGVCAIAIQFNIDSVNDKLDRMRQEEAMLVCTTPSLRGPGYGNLERIYDPTLPPGSIVTAEEFAMLDQCIADYLGRLDQ